MQIEYFIDIIYSLLLLNFTKNILLHFPWQSSCKFPMQFHNKPSVETLETIKSIEIPQETFLLLQLSRHFRPSELEHNLQLQFYSSDSTGYTTGCLHRRHRRLQQIKRTLLCDFCNKKVFFFDQKLKKLLKALLFRCRDT